LFPKFINEFIRVFVTRWKLYNFYSGLWPTMRIAVPHSCPWSAIYGWICDCII